MKLVRKGDRIFVMFDGRTVAADVILASANGHSGMLRFDGVLGGYVGMLPILWDRAGDGYVDLIFHRPVMITPYPNGNGNGNGARPR